MAADTRVGRREFIKGVAGSRGGGRGESRAGPRERRRGGQRADGGGNGRNAGRGRRTAHQVRRGRHQSRAHQQPGGRRAARRRRAGVVLCEGAGPGRRVRQAVSAGRSWRRASAKILEDQTIQLVLSSIVPDERAPLGIRVMQHGKDYMADKPGITTLAQLAEVRKVQAATRRIYSIMYSERFENRATVKAAGARQGRRDRPGRPDHRPRPAPHQPADTAGVVLRQGAVRRHPLRHRVAPGRSVPLLHRLDRAPTSSPRRSATSTTRSIRPSRTSATSCCAATAAPATSASTGSRPDGLATWGDGRLTILGTDGFIEIRKNIDIAGRDRAKAICSSSTRKRRATSTARTSRCRTAPRSSPTSLNRTETAMTQAHCFLATELMLKAQAPGAAAHAFCRDKR